MERPLCPICKTNHFAREPHTLGGGQVEEVILKKAEAQVSKAVKPEPGRLPEHAPVAKAPFDRKAYQREYMRKWRAKR